LQRIWASVDDVVLASLQDRIDRGHQKVRTDLGRRVVPRRSGGLPRDGRNGLRIPVVVANFGERFLRSGGVSGCERGGEMERTAGAICRHTHAMSRADNRWIEEGEKLLRAVTCVFNARLKMALTARARL
jgi:hypothetical protein